MTQRVLNYTQVHANFHQVRRVTMPQRLNTLLIIWVLRVFTTVIILSSIMRLKS